MEINAKEKSTELLRQTIILYEGWNDTGETLEEIKSQVYKYNIPWHKLIKICLYYIDENIRECAMYNSDRKSYWQAVKQELEKL